MLRLKYNDTNLGIAIVEVKKYDEGKSTSNDKEIFEFARKDKLLLRKQIDLISPDIIICCGTFNSYENGIFEGEQMKLIRYIDRIGKNKAHGAILSHRDRLVLNFYHPSSRISPMDLYHLLGELLVASKKGF